MPRKKKEAGFSSTSGFVTGLASGLTSRFSTTGETGNGGGGGGASCSGTSAMGAGKKAAKAICEYFKGK